MSGRRSTKGSLVPKGAEPLPPPESSSISRIQAEYFSGPIPPPSLLARYNDIIPNGAERILAMAERQSAHREALEAKVVEGNLDAQKRGSNRAFILALIVILGGVYLMATGKDAWGFAAIITSLASLVSVFAISKSQQRKERTEKATALDSRRKN